MKKYLKFYWIGIISSLILLCGISKVNAIQQIQANKKIEYLFIQIAKSGEIDYVPGTKQYKIVLNEVDPWTTYFSNVPHRITGLMSSSRFAQMVDDNVRKKYPKGLNAGLIFVSNDNLISTSKKQLIFSIKDPNYDSKDNTLSYSATLVPGEQLHTVNNKIEIEHPVLFIDTICVSCVGDGF